MVQSSIVKFAMRDILFDRFQLRKKKICKSFDGGVTLAVHNYDDNWHLTLHSSS